MVELSHSSTLNAGPVSAAAIIGGTASPGAPRPLSRAAMEMAAKPTRPAFSPIVVAGAFRAIEIAVIALAGFVAHYLYLFPTVSLTWSYSLTIAGIALLSVIIFQAADVYEIHALRRPSGQLPRLFSAWSVVFLIATTVTFFAKLDVTLSRIWLVTFYAMGFAALFGTRIAMAMIVRHWMREGRLTRRTAIVGGGDAGDSLIAAIDSQDDSDVQIVGIFDDRNDERAPDNAKGYQKLGTVDDLIQFARRTRIDLVIFSLPISAENRILQMLKKLWVLPVDIRLSAHTNKLRFRPRSYSYIGDVPVIDVADRPIADWDVVMKWLFDKVMGSLALIAAAPVMALIAIAIKLDSRGPILFRQKRYGFNNDLIDVYKFRSMYVDKTDATASKLVTKNDPRVTRVGRFIRKTSLDELPQLFNVVFKGNLSLVGPRPHAVNAKAVARRYDEAVDGYFARHRVKPGVTGWAQVNGWRGETDTEEKILKRVEFDLYYIENWSVLFDLYILAMTPYALLKTENAY
jgi:Undecaprenyl-phosphate glucose phosphotransferase